MRVDEEQILGNPVTLAMPKACINPIDPTETWNDDWKDGYDSVVCSWREDDDGKIEVMSKYTKQLKTVRKYIMHIVPIRVSGMQSTSQYPNLLPIVYSTLGHCLIVDRE